MMAKMLKREDVEELFHESNAFWLTVQHSINNY